MLVFKHTITIVYICSYTFLHILLLIATNNFLLPALLSFITLCVLLLIHYDIILSLLSISHPSVYIFFISSTLSLFICYLSSLNSFTPAFFIFFTTLTTFLSFFLAFLFIFGFHYWFYLYLLVQSLT